MEIISNPTQDEIKKAAKALNDGHLVAFPTETVYGLGADATNEKAVGRIYSVKGRPTDHPLIVHISSINQLDNWATDIPEYALKLAEEFWPGPMTLILKRSDLAKDFITGGQDNIGLRVPNQPIALALLREFESIGGLGIAAPSANRFGAVSPTQSDAVRDELKNFLKLTDLILDGGQCQIGIESTIIDCTNKNPYILRLGAITHKMIKDSFNYTIKSSNYQSKIKAPGLLVAHYSPEAKVILGGNTEKGDGFIAMVSIISPVGVVRLASPETVEEFAKVFYASLRLGDKKRLKRIVVIEPEGEGLAEAIRDRLKKSAAGN
jgi:L-threonylcarbamoyladenylate synthase